MTRTWIVVGDATSSGGQVITGSPFTDIDGKPVARITDQASCSTHKGTFPIVDGDTTTLIDGQPVALHGSSLACGCKVLAMKQMRVFLDTGGTAGMTPSSGNSLAAASAVASSLAAAPAYQEGFVLRSEETGKALANRPYRITTESGRVYEGKTDSEGQTAFVGTPAAEVLRVEIGEELVG